MLTPDEWLVAMVVLHPWLSVLLALAVLVATLKGLHVD